jgi:hypothetical protein
MSIRSKTRKIKLTNTPMYEPNKWNSNKYVKKSHNCYAYALNLIDSKQTKHCKQLNRTKKMNCPRPQPGCYSGYKDNFDAKKVTCNRIEERMMKDNPSIRKLKKNQPCPIGFYKIMLYVANDGSDYHFFRQDNTGLWSHKDGWRLATNHDSKDKMIHHPTLADKGKYTVPCGTYAVPISSNYKHMASKIECKTYKK